MGNALNCLMFEYSKKFHDLQTYISKKNRDSSCFISPKLYFIKFPFMKRSLDHIFFSKYQTTDLEDNYFDAVVSWLFYFQDREVSS